MKKTYHSPLSFEELMDVVDCLRRGKVGLFPTDTVYGLGCIANSSTSTTAIYRMKQRPLEKTLPLLIGGWETFSRYSKGVNAATRKRLQKRWPGALTVVVRASTEAMSLSYHCLRDGTVAMRMPDHPQLRFIIEQLGCPLAATSANLSEGVEALSLEMVPSSIRSLAGWGWSEAIPHTQPVPSTVVDLTGKTPKILRDGGVKF